MAVGHISDAAVSPTAERQPAGIVRVAGRRIDAVALLIVLAAFAVRVQLAATEKYIHDEENTSIPLSRTISFTPGKLHLPIRGENHGALPAYVVKASSIVFGTSPLGYRLGHLLLGSATALLIFFMARQWYGAVAARWATALFALNEYYLPVSARATAQVPTLFFDTAAIYAVSRFLSTQRVAYLYAAGAAVGFAFYCKESSALLLPVFFVTLLHPQYRRWLRSPHVYLACAVFFLMIGADLVWNMTTDRETARLDYGTQVAGYSTYQSHLQRVGGIGLSPYPAMFYARGPVMSLYQLVTGTELKDETPEYFSINPALGVLLIAAVLVTTFRTPRRDHLRWLLLLVFWGVFGFFTLIKKGDPPGRLDPVSWIWVEMSIIPAAVFAGARLADTTGALRFVTWTFGAAALAYAVWTIA